MTKVQMEAIADRAARLSVSKTDAEDAQVYAAMELDPYRQYYEEYLDQLQTGDTEWLRRWIGLEVADKVGEAVEILKMWIRAELSGQTMGVRLREEVGTIQRQVIKDIIIQAMVRSDAVTTDNAGRIEAGAEIAVNEILKEMKKDPSGGNRKRPMDK